MKANELMLGDWVILKSNGMLPDKIVQIEEISGQGLFVTDCDNLIGFDEIEPIPLTKEILEANGFIEDTERYGLRRLIVAENRKVIVSVGISGQVNVMDTRLDVYEARVCGIDLRYAHQLQHALRLVGLNDLADNFKVVTLQH